MYQGNSFLNTSSVAKQPIKQAATTQQWESLRDGAGSGTGMIIMWCRVTLEDLIPGCVSFLAFSLLC